MKSPGLVLVALACAGFSSVGCTHSLNPTVGQITPEHFEFTTVIKPRKSDPYGWRAVCIPI